MEPDRIGVLSSLSEPVRRRVYDLVVDAGEVNRDGAAERLGLARSVAAFHLDKLVDVGLLDVSYRRPPGQGGPGAGRPAKWYRRASWELTVSLPDRRYELAARLLAAAVDQAVERSQPVTRALRLVANRYGRQLGAAVSADGDPARAEALGLSPVWWCTSVGLATVSHQPELI